MATTKDDGNTFVAASPKDSDVDPSQVVGRHEGHTVGYYGYNPDDVEREHYTFSGAAKALREKNPAGGEQTGERSISPQSGKANTSTQVTK